MRVEQRETLACREVLRDQIQEQRRFTGAGLADDVEVPAPRLRGEHDGMARNAGTETKLLWLQCHGRNGAGVPCASRFGMMRAAPVPLGAPRLHGAVAVVR